MAKINLSEIKIQLWDDVNGIGFINGSESYVTLKEIGRCISLEGEELKSFVKIARLSKKVSPYISKRETYSRGRRTEALTISLNDLPYIYEIFIKNVIERQKKKNKSVNEGKKIKLFKSNYVFFQGTKPVMDIKQLRELFDIKEEDCSKFMNQENICIYDLINLILECGLNDQNSEEVKTIINEFSKASSLIEEISYNLINED